MPILSEKLLAPVDILVDTREASKNKEIVELLVRSGIRVAKVELNAGDYYLLAPEGKRPILVERKTVNDFLNSIRDNRIWEQAKLLKEVAREDDAQPLIILEGWLGVVEKRRKWNLTAVLRILDELVTDWGIPVLPTPHKQATAAWLAAKARSLGRTNEKRIVRLRVEKKPMSIYERILYVAEGIIGPKLARKLLEHFKTLKAVANASVSELMRVEGIGEKRAREIYAIFNTPWRPPETEGKSNR